MAKYGTPQYQQKPNEPNDANKIVGIIVVLLAITKVLVGNISWYSFIFLGIVGVSLATIIDSFVGGGKVRSFEKRKRGGMKIYDKNKEPFDYWLAVIRSWIFSIGFSVVFFGL